LIGWRKRPYSDRDSGRSIGRSVACLHNWRSWHFAVAVQALCQDAAFWGNLSHHWVSFLLLLCYHYYKAPNTCYGTVYCASQKIPSLEVFWRFPKRLEIFTSNFTCLLYIPIYAKLQIFIQLSSTVTKLCHIKCDHPACVSADGGHYEHMVWIRWSYLIWHNIIRVGVNWIKIYILV